jgi:Rrf2 family protein
MVASLFRNTCRFSPARSAGLQDACGREQRMKLTRASSYALHALAYMAAQKKDQPTASHIIAEKRRIPERFLLKVLKPLVSAQLLTSVKGPNGGYRLARSAQDISVLDVLEAVEGPIRGQAPCEEPNHPTSRRLEAICQQSADQVRKHLGKIKIADLNGRE